MKHRITGHLTPHIQKMTSIFFLTRIQILTVLPIQERSLFQQNHNAVSLFKNIIPKQTDTLICYYTSINENKHLCKADIRNPLSLLAHERSRFATCQWELLTPTDISIPLTHRLVLYALEAGECLFCVQTK